jgi:predicted anti-sigma-YlaC factor YlaD
MNVTDAVVKDLLALYLAGEAHPDTRAIVEEWLRSHPEMVHQVEQARGAGLPDVAVPPPTAEKRILDRVRRRWRARSIVLGAAIYFSTLPLTVTFNSSGFHGLLIDNWPQRIVLLIIGAALWGLYVAMPRR